MKVLFVWVSVKQSGPIQYLPLGIGYLAANLSKKIKIRLWDGMINQRPNINVLNVIKRFKPDLVVFSVWNYNLTQAIETVSLIKKNFPELKVLAGGVSVSGYKENIFRVLPVDYAIAGEGEQPLTAFLKLLGDNKLSDNNLKKISGLIYKNRKGVIVSNPVLWGSVSKLNYCDYKFINLSAYLNKGYYYGIHPVKSRTAPLITTRGCPFPCEFCCARLVNGRVIRVRPAKSIIAEIKELYSRYKITGFNIIDDNFTFNLEFAKLICREIIKLNLKNVTFCCPNGVKLEYLDEELLSLMKKAGWTYIYIAPESGSRATLKKMHKIVNLSLVSERIKMIKKYGIKVFGFFIIGYPGETIKDIKKTIDFACNHDFDAVGISGFKPFPGTPVWDKIYSPDQLDLGHLGTDYLKVTYAPAGIGINRLKLLRFWGIFRFYTGSFARMRNLFNIYRAKRLLTIITELLH